MSRSFGQRAADALERLRRERQLPPAWRHMAVIFTAPDREIERLDISLGPCIPRPGVKRPLAGPFRQSALRPRQAASLYRLFVPAGADSPWSEARTVGAGTLCRCRPDFVSALAALSRTYQGSGKATEEEKQALGRVFEELGRRWVELDGVGSPLADRKYPDLDIATAAWWARAAEERDQGLYFWFGPGVMLTMSAAATERLATRVEASDIARR